MMGLLYAFIATQVILALVAARRGLSNLAAFIAAAVISPFLGAAVAVVGQKRKAGTRWRDFVLWDFLKPFGMVALGCFILLAAVVLTALVATTIW
jgi:hypothetical protein